MMTREELGDLGEQEVIEWLMSRGHRAWRVGGQYDAPPDLLVETSTGVTVAAEVKRRPDNRSQWAINVSSHRKFLRYAERVDHESWYVLAPNMLVCRPQDIDIDVFGTNVGPTGEYFLLPPHFAEEVT